MLQNIRNCRISCTWQALLCRGAYLQCLASSQIPTFLITVCNPCAVPYEEGGQADWRHGLFEWSLKRRFHHPNNGIVLQEFPCFRCIIGLNSTPSLCSTSSCVWANQNFLLFCSCVSARWLGSQSFLSADCLVITSMSVAGGRLGANEFQLPPQK